MPTAALNRPQPSNTVNASPSIEDIDALLSQADALLNDVQTDFGGQTDSPVQAGQSTSKASEPTSREEDIQHLAEEVSFSAKDVDAEAVAALLNSPDLTADADADPAEKDESAEDEPAEAELDTSHKPQSAPQDWLNEAASADDLIPSIPDENTRVEASGSRPVAAIGAARKLLAGTLGQYTVGKYIARLFRLPMEFLILLDRPFAKMDQKAKSFLGYAAIATLMVATGTWIYGDLRTIP